MCLGKRLLTLGASFSDITVVSSLGVLDGPIPRIHAFPSIGGRTAAPLPRADGTTLRGN